MANTCSNTIKLSGTETSITNFKEVAIEYNYQHGDEIYESVFLLENLHQLTIEHQDNCTDNYKEQSFMPGYYPYWWEEHENTGTTYTFTLPTKWVPPLQVFNQISKHYPDLLIEISYWGMANGFIGGYSVKNGEVIKSEHFENDEYDAFFDIEEPLKNDEHGVLADKDQTIYTKSPNIIPDVSEDCTELYGGFDFK